MDLGPGTTKRELLMMSMFAGLAATAIDGPHDRNKFQGSSLSRKTPEQRAEIKRRRKMERANKKRGRQSSR